MLFTFFAERYERRSLLISSNLVFSQWEKIFQDPILRIHSHAHRINSTFKLGDAKNDSRDF